MAHGLDMNLHWLRDKEQNKHFNVVWNAGKDNFADYHSKPGHPLYHHKKMRKIYVRDVLNVLYTHLSNIKRCEVILG